MNGNDDPVAKQQQFEHLGSNLSLLARLKPDARRQRKIEVSDVVQHMLLDAHVKRDQLAWSLSGDRGRVAELVGNAERKNSATHRRMIVAQAQLGMALQYVPVGMANELTVESLGLPFRFEAESSSM